MVALPVMVVGASRPRICERSLYKGFDNRFERTVTAAYDGDTILTAPPNVNTHA